MAKNLIIESINSISAGLNYPSITPISEENLFNTFPGCKFSIVIGLAYKKWVSIYKCNFPAALFIIDNN